MKKISVIITAYNVERFIEETVISVLKQSFSNIEIIIINDASTDSTLSILQKLKDERIKLINLEENIGLGNALNLGIEHVTGDYFHILDGDDRYSSQDVLEKLVIHCKDNPDLIRGKMRFWKLKKNNNSLEEDFVDVEYDHRIPHISKPTTLIKNPIIMLIDSSNQFLINVRWAKSINAAYKLRHFEDAPFLTELITQARSIILTDILIFDYRKMIGENFSITQKSINKEDIDLYMQHVDIMFDLFRSYGIESFLYLINTQRYLRRLCDNFYRRVINQRNKELFSYYLDCLKEAFLKHKINSQLVSLSQTLSFNSEEQLPAYSKPEHIESGYYFKFIFLLNNNFYTELKFIDQPQKHYEMIFKKNNKFIKDYIEIIFSYDNKYKVTPVPAEKCKKVYIHIGATKTGSTSIQNFLKKNHKTLREANYFFPLYKFHKEKDRNVRTAGHIELCNHPQTYLNSVFERCKKNEVLVLSSENISAKIKKSPMTWLKICRILSNYEIIPILYLREQSEWIQSMYNEFVTGTNRRWTGGIENFAEEQDVLDLDYNFLCQKVHLPKNINQIKITIFDQKIKGSKLIPSFLKSIDFIDNFVKLSTENSNKLQDINYAESNPSLPQSLTPYFLALNQSKINDTIYKSCMRYFYKDYFYKNNPQNLKRSYQKQLKKYFVKYSESNMKLAKKIGLKKLFDQPNYSDIDSTNLCPATFKAFINALNKAFLKSYE